MLDTEKIILRYHERIKDQYPDLTIEELTKICRAPFIFLKEQMAKPILPRIRFQFWGVYYVKDNTLNNAKEIADYALGSGKITQEKHDKIITIVNIANESKDKLKE